jgi:hypothetical protein
LQALSRFFFSAVKRKNDQEMLDAMPVAGAKSIRKNSHQKAIPEPN